MNPIARLVVCVDAGLLLGALLLLVFRVPDLTVRLVALASGAALVTVGLVEWRRRRKRVTVLGIAPALDDGECRYCGRPASASVGYTRRRGGGRILTCSAHTHLAVAEATR